MPKLSCPPLLKIGFFGGTFDPIHTGHEFICEEAIKEFELDKLLLCPAYQAPLRNTSPLFTAEQRLAMVRLVAENHSRVAIFDFEINKKQASFTWQTIQEVRRIYPKAKILLLIGYDQFTQLSKWKFLNELSQAVHFVVFAREQPRAPLPTCSELSFTLMNNSLLNISSTSIREHLHQGNSIEGMVPKGVYSYLQTKHLLTNSNQI
ncbi:MAG: nicotinate (nicotinamide) nucleotide adenylyltransferase [Opitutales bacterium]|nr:nicotinate (nicotinamide) nucleotide adenylyltransferase [Opitutales bacterium]